MHSVLMNLFTGNLNLSERPPADFPLRKYYSKEYDKLRKQLENLLNDEGQEALSGLLDTYSGDIYADIEAFITGFRLATMLMIEVFHDKDDLLDNKEQHLRHMLHRPFRGTPSPSFCDDEG